jgi:hypothetical protein
MKHCRKCDRTLDESEFCKAKDKKDGLRPNCKQCTRAKSKAHYLSQKGSYSARNKRKRAELRDYLHTILSRSSCRDCGETDPTVLEFDHFGDKSHNVSSIIKNNLGQRVLDEELVKCHVRCGNCHQRKTCAEQNWYSDILSEVTLSLHEAVL